MAPHVLKRQFEANEPSKVWVTDFTYVRTHEAWLYLMVVFDLFSCQVVGWCMKNNARADLVIDALLLAIWRRKPKQRVMVHWDKGVQYTEATGRDFWKTTTLEPVESPWQLS